MSPLLFKSVLNFVSRPLTQKMSKFSRSSHSSNNGLRPVGRKYIPEQVPPTDRDICGTLFSGRLIAVGAGLYHCKGLPPTGIEDLILDQNPISSFVGFPPMHSLKSLSMNSTNISDFRGFPLLPNLEVISLNGTPVMSHPYARLALLLLCPRVRTVNGEPVTGSERQLTKLYPSECPSLIRSGWMPTVPPPKEKDIEKISRTLVEKRRAAYKREPQKVVKPLSKPETQVKQSDYLAYKIMEKEMDIERIQEEIDKLRGE